MPPLYDIGDMALIRGEFRDSDGNLADPATVTGVIVEPDNVATDLGEIHNTDIGVWDAVYPVSKPGRHAYTLRGVGGAVQQTVRGVLWTRWPGNRGPRDLCSLDDVRGVLNLKPSDADDDAWIQDEIGAVSRQIERATGREFVARNTVLDANGVRYAGALTRRFRVSSARSELPIGDATSVDAVELITRGSSSAITLDFTYVDLLPYDRAPWEPIRRLGLEFAGYAPGAGALVDVTGVWGWPQVPDDIARACMWEVALRFERSISTFTETFATDENRIVRERGFGTKSWDIIAGYRTVGPILV